MSSFLIDGRFPPIQSSPSKDITSDERSTAMDFVNRHNFIFQEFNHEKMIATFLPDAVVYHSHGTIRGHAEIKHFFENTYGFFIPGMSRHATNHVVDRDADGGVVIRYQETLIRYGWGEDNANVVSGRDVVRNDGLPAIWWFGPIIDRLRMTADGWKIFERYLGASFRNRSLDLPKTL
ncbi:hypothetical protein BDW59DRAFT_178448 [Aspergillus cavernicola]|uniref:SnoaL-like domain-containing protein n=1 Tax=Aspergillus cavernicola TaxID=176166 RepID=A0ABR4INX3_9EURO